MSSLLYEVIIRLNHSLSADFKSTAHFTFKLLLIPRKTTPFLSHIVTRNETHLIKAEIDRRLIQNVSHINVAESTISEAFWVKHCHQKVVANVFSLCAV